MRHILSILVGAMLASPLATAEEPQGIVAPGAELVTLSEDFRFTEGPAVDAEGNVFFTDQPNDRIMKWSVDGEMSTFLQPAGRSNGMYFDKKGNLLACADEKNQLWSIDPEGNVTVLVENFEGKLLNGPNDLWIRPDGGVYFTDPLYRRDYWDRGPMEQDGHHVYYMTPDYQTVTRVADDLVKPNGIIGTPDGKTLYVADIDDRKIYSYSIQEDGSLSDKTLFCEHPSDGMTIDNEGNIYITNNAGVTVFDKTGKQIDNIRTGQGWTANVCFGGKDRQTLFITAGTGFYSIQTRVKGVQ